MVSFEIRDIRVTSPDWRGKFLTRLQLVTRQEAAAVWAIDQAGFEQLIEHCAGDPRTNVLQAPSMTAPIGAPARMSSEESVAYVAAVTRKADGPPNQATRVAFEPQVDKVHNGVRVNVVSSQVKGNVLFAHLVIEEHRLVTFHTTAYSEIVRPSGHGDRSVVKTSLLERLGPQRGPQPAAIKAAFQVPEVDSRRIEGEWLIPSSGALVVSLGPRGGSDKGFLRSYEEHMVAITAQIVAEQVQPGSGAVQPASASPNAIAPAAALPSR
jgi:hypothetical protein